MRVLVRGQTLDQFPHEPPAPPKPFVPVSYESPIGRLKREMKRLGARPFERYTTADFHFERPAQFTTEGPAGGITRWTQQFWLYFGSQQERHGYANIHYGSSLGVGKVEFEPGHFVACYTPNPSGSMCAPDFDSLDKAVDQLIAWAEETPYKG